MMHSNHSSNPITVIEPIPLLQYNNHDTMPKSVQQLETQPKMITLDELMSYSHTGIKLLQQLCSEPETIGRLVVEQPSLQISNLALLNGILSRF